MRLKSAVLSRCSPLIIVLSLTGSVALVAQEKEPAAELPSPEFQPLDLFIGPWHVEQKHFDATGAIVATAEGTEEITWVLKKHAMQRIYRTKSGAAAYGALGLLTWNGSTKQFEGMWFDDASTAGPMQVTGQWNEKDRTFVFDLERPDGKGGREKYKTIERFESEKSRLATTYKVAGSEIVKINEVTCTRTAPCPDRLRVIFDQ